MLNYLQISGWEARHSEHGAKVIRYLAERRMALGLIDSYLTPSGLKLIEAQFKAQNPKACWDRLLEIGAAPSAQGLRACMSSLRNYRWTPGKSELPGFKGKSVTDMYSDIAHLERAVQAHPGQGIETTEVTIARIVDTVLDAHSPIFGPLLQTLSLGKLDSAGGSHSLEMHKTSILGAETALGMSVWEFKSRNSILYVKEATKTAQAHAAAYEYDTEAHDFGYQGNPNSLPAAADERQQRNKCAICGGPHTVFRCSHPDLQRCDVCGWHFNKRRDKSCSGPHHQKNMDQQRSAGQGKRDRGKRGGAIANVASSDPAVDALRQLAETIEKLSERMGDLEALVDTQT
jgi:hypothetical protein